MAFFQIPVQCAQIWQMHHRIKECQTMVAPGNKALARCQYGNEVHDEGEKVMLPTY